VTTGFLADPERAPAVGVRRLLVAVTGAAAASSVPGWLAWLRDTTDLELTVVTTRSAGRFVTPAALAAATGAEVLVDEWPAGGADPVHVRLAEWAEAVVVFPATLHFLARYALGLADTPLLLALQSTAVPVAVAPALPPGAAEGVAFRQHRDRLAERGNVVVVPAHRGTSQATRRPALGSPAPLPEVLAALEEQRTRVESFGTGLLETTVRRLPAGAEWIRRPGPRAGGFPVAAPVEDPVGPVRLVGGGTDPDRRTYQVGGDRSLAAELLDDGPGRADLLDGLGRALRRLHDRPAAPSPPPPGLRRLRDWLDGRAAEPVAADAAGLLREILAEPKWAALTDWARDLDGGADAVRVHGAPSLAALVPDPDGGTAALLTGEDLGTASRAYDLGFVLGELVELRWRRGGDAASWQRLVDALAAGYGRDLGPALHRAAVLRIALHLQDFTAYVRWDADEIKRYGSFLGFLVEADRPC
jgi:phosphopantothenoylcysteine decarboxylase / phosphopantothenate---cysteine ligase